MSIDDDSEGKLYKVIGFKSIIVDLVYDMIIYSSNFVINILIELVDVKKVIQIMWELGVLDIQVL